MIVIPKRYIPRKFDSGYYAELLRDNNPYRRDIQAKYNGTECTLTHVPTGITAINDDSNNVNTNYFRCLHALLKHLKEHHWIPCR